MGGSGAGSGGGGGSSGTIDYPAYMKERHSDMYDAIKDAVAVAQSGNPYNYVQAWDPSYSMYKMEAIAECWYNFYDQINPACLWETIAGVIPNKVKEIFTPDDYANIIDLGKEKLPSAEDFEASIGNPDWEKIFANKTLTTNLDKYPDEYDRPTAQEFEDSIITPDWDDLFDSKLLKKYLEKIPLDYVWDNSAINEYLDNAKTRICEKTRDEIIPQYRRGMQDIGAVMTSAYKIGEALFWAKVVQDTTDLEKDIKMKVVEKEKDAKIHLAEVAYDTDAKLALLNYETRGDYIKALKEAKMRYAQVAVEYTDNIVLQKMKDMGSLALTKSEKWADFESLIKEYKAKYGLSDAEIASKLIMARMELLGKFGLLYYEQIFKSIGDVLNVVLQKISWIQNMMHYYLEIERMTYTAMKEYTDSKNIYKIEQTKWNLEMFKYQMDALGSIASSAGTSYTTSSSGTSRLSSAIGGALTGASAGAMTGAAIGSSGGPIGAAIGGAVGLIGGIL